MNYQYQYNKIITKSKSENRLKLKKTDINYIYYENHHINPKCLGGEEEKENKILLTAREHYVCHKLLTYIYPKNGKISSAFYFMAFSKRYGNIVSSRDYEYARKLCSENRCEYNRIHKKGKSYKTQMIEKYGEIEGIKRTIEYTEKICKNTKGEKNPMFKKGYKIIGEKNGMYGKSAVKGKKCTLEHNRKISEAKMGVKRNTQLCPYCNRKISDGNYERWHGNNCKNKNKNI
jgi:hypothetical protein